MKRVFVFFLLVSIAMLPGCFKTNEIKYDYAVGDIRIETEKGKTTAYSSRETDGIEILLSGNAEGIIEVSDRYLKIEKKEKDNTLIAIAKIGERIREGEQIFTANRKIEKEEILEINSIKMTNEETFEIASIPTGISIESKTIPVNSEGYISIYGKGINDLKGCELEITYDASYLEIDTTKGNNGVESSNVIGEALTIVKNGKGFLSISSAFVKDTIKEIGEGLLYKIYLKTKGIKGKTEINIQGEIRNSELEIIDVSYTSARLIIADEFLLLGDFDRNDEVKLIDFMNFANHYNSEEGDGVYERKYDIAPAEKGNGLWSDIYVLSEPDGSIKLLDFIIFANNYNKESPYKIPLVERISGPSEGITNATQTFEWNGIDFDGTITSYEYRKDGGIWENTEEAHYTWSSIPVGYHTFEVRAKNNYGNYSLVIIWEFNYFNIVFDGNVDEWPEELLISEGYFDSYENQEPRVEATEVYSYEDTSYVYIGLKIQGNAREQFEGYIGENSINLEIAFTVDSKQELKYTTNFLLPINDPYYIMEEGLVIYGPIKFNNWPNKTHIMGKKSAVGQYLIESDLEFRLPKTELMEVFPLLEDFSIHDLMVDHCRGFIINNEEISNEDISYEEAWNNTSLRKGEIIFYNNQHVGIDFSNNCFVPLDSNEWDVEIETFTNDSNWPSYHINGICRYPIPSDGKYVEFLPYYNEPFYYSGGITLVKWIPQQEGEHRLILFVFTRERKYVQAELYSEDGSEYCLKWIMQDNGSINFSENDEIPYAFKRPDFLDFITLFEIEENYPRANFPLSASKLNENEWIYYTSENAFILVELQNNTYSKIFSSTTLKEFRNTMLLHDDDNFQTMVSKNENEIYCIGNNSNNVYLINIEKEMINKVILNEYEIVSFSKNDSNIYGVTNDGKIVVFDYGFVLKDIFETGISDLVSINYWSKEDKFLITSSKGERIFFLPENKTIDSIGKTINLSSELKSIILENGNQIIADRYNVYEYNQQGNIERFFGECWRDFFKFDFGKVNLILKKENKLVLVRNDGRRICFFNILN